MKPDLEHTELPFQTLQTSRVRFWKQLADTVQRPMKLGKASIGKSALTKLGLQVSHKKTFFDHCPIRKKEARTFVKPPRKNMN